MGIYENDMGKARAFYEGFLGYQSSYTLPRPNGSGELVCIKINDRQVIELFPAEVAPDAPRFYHVAFEVDDAEAMRAYLASRGVAVPDSTPRGKVGNANYFIKDPNGNVVEIVQYLPTGWTRRDAGKFLPDTRISTHLRHFGVATANLDAALKFYCGILGFKEIWRGSADGKQLSWVHLRVPEGEDFIELMLYQGQPSIDRVRSMQHVCLEVPNVAATEAVLKTRVPPPGSKAPTPLKVGVNGKRQVNYFDPDGTRVEVMEPDTVDHHPRPPSSAPPPVGEPLAGR